MSFAAGHLCNYKEDPYARHVLPRGPALLGAAGDQKKIYPFSELMQSGSSLLDDFGGHELTVRFDRRSKTAQVETDNPGSLTYFVSYLHDLKAFFPDAEIFKARR